MASLEPAGLPTNSLICAWKYSKDARAKEERAFSGCPSLYCTIFLQYAVDIWIICCVCTACAMQWTLRIDGIKSNNYVSRNTRSSPTRCLTVMSMWKKDRLRECESWLKFTVDLTYLPRGWGRIKTMSINPWCLIQKDRRLTRNLTRMLCTNEAQIDIFCKHLQPQPVKRSWNI